jgi:hypothetical protein
MPILRGGPSVGYAMRLYLPPDHIRDNRELLDEERSFQHCGGQPPVQRHSGQTSSLLVYGGGPLCVPSPKDAIPQWCLQDLGRP